MHRSRSVQLLFLVVGSWWRHSLHALISTIVLFYRPFMNEWMNECMNEWNNLFGTNEHSTVSKWATRGCNSACYMGQANLVHNSVLQCVQFRQITFIKLIMKAWNLQRRNRERERERESEWEREWPGVFLRHQTLTCRGVRIKVTPIYCQSGTDWLCQRGK